MIPLVHCVNGGLQVRQLQAEVAELRRRLQAASAERDHAPANPGALEVPICAIIGFRPSAFCWQQGAGVTHALHSTNMIGDGDR